MSQIGFMRAFVAQSQKNGLGNEALSNKQMYQLIQLRILYKLAKMPGESKENLVRQNRACLKVMAILVTILHLSSISNLPYSPLYSLSA